MMMKVLRAILNRFPALKALARAIYNRLPTNSVSTNYIEIEGTEAQSEAKRLASSWQDPSIPQRQRHLVDGQLAAYERGEAVDAFDVMRSALLDLHLATGPVSLLEIGCASGYYSEVIAPVEPGFAYSGCDYSEPLIVMARQHYPEIDFEVADATRLDYQNNAYQVVVSGCCLLHIPDYRAAVAETARVASQYAIFHRTPVVVGQPEKIYRKNAYGVETVEIHFNESQFLHLLEEFGFVLVNTYSLAESITNGVGSAMRTYVCKKSVAA